MNLVCFSNPGTIDPRSITTFGVNSKDCKNPIGYFGTGLKYAIAVLLRSKHRVTLFSDTEKYEFSVKSERIRNDEFDVVHMNDQPLGFTTELGKNWKLWQAFRELYCNALDEGGTAYEMSDAVPHPVPGHVCVFVEGRDFRDVFAAREQYFPDFTAMGPNHGTQDVEVYHRKSQSLYFKGIHVTEIQRPAKLTYNFQSGLKLTEDRTVTDMWTAHYYIANTLLKCKNLEVLRTALLSGPDHLEGHLDYSGVPSQEFIDFVLANKHNPLLNLNAKVCVKKFLGMLYYNTTPCELNVRERRTLDRAHELVEKIQSKITYPIFVTEEFPPDTLAMALRDKKEIWLNRALLAQGALRVASTLFEENAHLQRGVDDCSREMQNFLLDTLFGLVESL